MRSIPRLKTSSVLYWIGSWTCRFTLLRLQHSKLKQTENCSHWLTKHPFMCRRRVTVGKWKRKMGKSAIFSVFVPVLPSGETASAGWLAPTMLAVWCARVCGRVHCVLVRGWVRHVCVCVVRGRGNCVRDCALHPTNACARGGCVCVWLLEMHAHATDRGGKRNWLWRFRDGVQTAVSRHIRGVAGCCGDWSAVGWFATGCCCCWSGVAGAVLAN